MRKKSFDGSRGERCKEIIDDKNLHFGEKCKKLDCEVLKCLKNSKSLLGICSINARHIKNQYFVMHDQVARSPVQDGDGYNIEKRFIPQHCLSSYLQAKHHNYSKTNRGC